jgi:hypothetical protein
MRQYTAENIENINVYEMYLSIFSIIRHCLRLKTYSAGLAPV